MAFDPTFLDAVRDLYAPAQGTERMAELLYLLIRFARPRTVLEAGMGYTSAFIAKALHDNRLAWERERDALVRKTGPYLAAIGSDPAEEPAAARAAPRGLDAVYAPKATRLANRRTEWMFAEPALLRPAHYLEPHTPRAYCVDDLSNPRSTAPRVREKLAELGLDDVVSVHEGDFWTFDHDLLPPDAKPVDLIWIDAPLRVLDAMSLVEGAHWDLLSPDGGLVLIHCMLSNEGGHAIREAFENVRRQSEEPPFEILGLLEPHKVVQNNVLILRRVTGAPAERVEDAFTAPGESVFEADARKLCAVSRAAAASPAGATPDRRG